MTTIEYVNAHVFPAVFALLPPRMDTRQARAMLLAIGLQESLFKYRLQIRGPARGFWQFEQRGGVRGVLEHSSTKDVIRPVLETMSYDSRKDYAPSECYEAIAHNDVLATMFARLLLWSSPLPLPKEGDAHGGWQLYLSTWRPGKPKPGPWDANFERAWGIVTLPAGGIT